MFEIYAVQCGGFSTVFLVFMPMFPQRIQVSETISQIIRTDTIEPTQNAAVRAKNMQVTPSNTCVSAAITIVIAAIIRVFAEAILLKARF